ncbi:tyrosine-type recombinase/integrase [Brevibacillus brevis]|uniref:tyrosine-type recombinase/integrase n=1 Tax=Brevibacillus brevis TaxID=1393 RepID=UPI000B333F17|nr:tyrosine-type recombinase/integrase [Brevibacillus brevis]
MNRSLHLVTNPNWKAASVCYEEYEDLVLKEGNCRQPRSRLRPAKYFLTTYPDLEAWSKLPLVERVGLLPGNPKGNWSAQARHFIYFLALRGYLELNWDWIIGVGEHRVPSYMMQGDASNYIGTIVKKAVELGYAKKHCETNFGRLFKHLHLKHPNLPLSRISEKDITEFENAIDDFNQHNEKDLLFPNNLFEQSIKEYKSALFRLRVVLYHIGQITSEPKRIHKNTRQTVIPKPFEDLLNRYIYVRKIQGARPATLGKIASNIRSLVHWLVNTFPEITSYKMVARDHILTYAQMLNDTLSPQKNRPYSLESKLTRLSTISTFFQDMASWGWEDVPLRPLLGPRDLPKRPIRIPRYIPEDELNRLMDQIRMLLCPYQRTALLIARWSGARRGEIRNLELDCLDTYPDGTPRLRIPVGKGRSERIIPLNEEAAEAIRDLQSQAGSVRGFTDNQTGKVAKRLFVRRGLRLSATYLFETSLGIACRGAGLTDDEGNPTVNAHRFRHTVATQLAERGAKIHTIMRVLGHTSVEMTMVYAQISDRTVLEDYQKVLGPGATIAGPLATALRSGTVRNEDIDWIKKNFFKTELELGHCLRLPQEGPCECDLYLSCAKFVTTKDYAPRLRARRKREIELIAEAQENGWEREVERHMCTVQRIDNLLVELNEPVED